MKREFDYIKDEMIDLSNQEHRDIVIERNKALEKALADGLQLSKVTASVKITLSFDCVVCGNLIKESSNDFHPLEFLDDLKEYDLFLRFPELECECCKSVYTYNENNEVFDLKKGEDKRE